MQNSGLSAGGGAVILGAVTDGRQIVEAFFRRARADRKKWTHLADESGVARSTIQRWEEGVTPEIDNFVSVVYAAGYTLGEMEEEVRVRDLARKGIRGLREVAEEEVEYED